jgi:hypothetical protein
MTAQEKKPGLKRGRPTDYKPELCDDILEFFGATEECYRESEVTVGGKNWERTETKLLPTKLPTLEGWACKHGIHPGTVWDWTQRHPDFANAVTRVKAWQKQLLIQGGIMGVYDSKFAQFVAINVTDMRNTLTVDNNLQLTLRRDPKELEMMAEMAREIGARIASGQLPQPPQSGGKDQQGETIDAEMVGNSG